MEFDTVILNGTIVDGTGSPRYRGNVGMVGGNIAAIGNIADAEARNKVDASDHIVAPGFIDMHSHSDITMFDDPGGESKACRGVTTEVVGNCGSSTFPAGLLTAQELRDMNPRVPVQEAALQYDWTDFDGWANALETHGISLNVVGQIGHVTLRQAARAMENRPANDEELAVMKRLVSESVEQGAVALTTALTGPPAMFATPEEIASLAAEAARYEGTFYATHAKLLEGNHFNAVDEATDIGYRTGIPIQYSHIALIDTRYHGQGAEMVRRMERARADGVDVQYDMYPYTAGAAGVSSLMPLWAQDADPTKLVERLKNPDDRRSRGIWRRASGAVFRCPGTSTSSPRQASPHFSRTSAADGSTSPRSGDRTRSRCSSLCA